MEGPISFWGYKEQESNLILPEHDDDEAMCKNIVKPERPQMTIWHMRIVRCMLKATNTHSEYVIPIAFPLKQ